jgi:anti-sigma B factor antagonist
MQSTAAGPWRPFGVTPHITAGGSRLVLRGELDAVGAPRLARYVERLSRAGRILHIDLTHVDFVDSCGVRALLDAQQRSAAAGARFRLTPPRGAARLALDICGLLPALVREPPRAAVRPVA